MMIIANGEDIEYKKVYGEKSLRVFEPYCSFPGLIYIPKKDYGISKQSMNGDWEHYEIGKSNATHHPLVLPNLMWLLKSPLNL